MKFKRSIFLNALLPTFLFLILNQHATACPNCRESTKNTPGASIDEQYSEARAFNKSIYLMAGMPFAIVAGLGFFIRSLVVKQNSVSNNQSPKHDA